MGPAGLEPATLEPGSVEDFGRDLFIFSFYARGMNLADIAALKPESIRDGRIFYTRKKTGRVIPNRSGDGIGHDFGKVGGRGVQKSSSAI